MITGQSISNYLSLGYIFSTYLLFVILGYFIKNGLLDKIKSTNIILGFILSFSITVVLQFIGYANEYNLVTRYDSVGILFSSVCLFEIMRRYCDNFSNNVMKIISYISKRAFAIYMIHIFFVESIFLILNREIVIINAEVTTLIYLIVPLICSIIIIQLLQKNKFIKKYILMIKG